MGQSGGLYGHTSCKPDTYPPETGGGGKGCSRSSLPNPLFLYSPDPVGMLASKCDLPCTPERQSRERVTLEELVQREAGNQCPTELQRWSTPRSQTSRVSLCYPGRAHLGPKVFEQPGQAGAGVSGSKGWTEHRRKQFLDCEFLGHIPRESKLI